MNEAGLVQLCLKLLDVFKIVAPAFAMAWADRLRQRAADAEARAARATTETEVAREETALAKETANLPRRQLMQRLLERGARRRDQTGSDDSSG